MLGQSVETVSFLARKHKADLKNLKIETIRDLVFYFPRVYEDRSAISAIRELFPAGSATVEARIKTIKNRPAKKRKMTLTEAVFEDATGAGSALWFNQPYLSKMLSAGTAVRISGSYKKTFFGPSFISPAYEIIRGEAIHTGRIVPVYPALGGISQKTFRRVVHQCLQRFAPSPEWLPDGIIKSDKLMPQSSALSEIHFPTNWKNLREASRRFKFEELFLFLMRGEMTRQELKSERSTAVPIDIPKIKQFIAGLPFSLTVSQKRAAWEIIQDLSKGRPMNRLLDGDVGSGKTAVAAIAAHSVASSSGQAAFMAPTEILAKQHFATFLKFFEKERTGIGLLTGSGAYLGSDGMGREVKRTELLKAIAENGVEIIIGTHALIFCAKDAQLVFKNLVLAIIDEQHRFGVEQRHALKNFGEKSPHLLSMTATPIPRSLALVFYGDLDVSLLKELPAGRKAVKTVLVPSRNETQVDAQIREEIASGRQAFVICPLIDPSDILEVRSAKEEFERLRLVFPDINVGLLHGKLKAQEKDKVMADFKNNKISILVSTSVVEVGVDVPNATAMIIRGAERFGLSQLHQFRGRIGRGEQRSVCYVFFENKNPLTLARLKFFAAEASGFALAEKDLAFRGPGEIFGTRQSGESELAFSGFADMEIASAARAAARTTLDKDRRLIHAPLLAAKLRETEKKIHLE